MPVVYGDVHCIIGNGDGDDHSGSCQTFSPNCAVKLPMSPSIRGKPVHVFAEDCLLISRYYYLQQGITSFLGPILSTCFQKCIPGFWAWLGQYWSQSLYYSISIEFAFFLAISPAREKLNLCENEFWATQHLQIKGWHKCKSCETSKRLHLLHLSLYLWDCICWNSLSNFL